MTHNGMADVSVITVKLRRIIGISLLKRRLAKSKGADCIGIGAKRPHARSGVGKL